MHSISRTQEWENVKYKIITHGPPIKQKTRRLNPILAKKVKQILLDWKTKKIMRKSDSSWAAPIVCVLKKY